MPTLSAPEAPLEDVWVTVCVELRRPLAVQDGDDMLVGYQQHFGIRCHPSDLGDVLASSIEDGTIRWERTGTRRVDVTAGFDPGVESRITPVETTGIWYRSGRAFFTAWGEGD